MASGVAGVSSINKVVVDSKAEAVEVASVYRVVVVVVKNTAYVEPGGLTPQSAPLKPWKQMHCPDGLHSPPPLQVVLTAQN